MKKLVQVSMLVLTLVTVSTAQDPGWPRQKVSPAGKLIYYQPQVDDWLGHTDLRFRTAFSLTPTGGKEVIGILNIHANTDVNVDARTVVMSNPVIAETHFPSLDASTAAQMDQLVRTFLPLNASVVISLDRLVATMSKSQPAATVPVRNDPPAIFVSNRPAILAQTDGPPITAEIKDTNMQFIVNTNWPIFFDKSHSNYYLFTGKQWLTATNLNGAWLGTATLPKDMSNVAKDPQWVGLAKAISPVAIASGAAPTVFSSTGPAEVILFDGQPVYSNIPGTQLVYASNTDVDLFVYKPTQQYFFLAAGRWFSSASLQGPWTYATTYLPADFAAIPRGSPASRVLVSVPGTEEAKDAVLLAQVPTTVEVNPATAAAQANVVYSGSPEFKPIEGTSLSYAINTTDKVIQVGDVYYLCLQGIWFMSPNPQGPWQTAASVPEQIYMIPPSSPVYNVTYVTQTTTSSGSVESSYTAGYMGTFIVGAAVGAIIAGGTGYYYPPYIYRPVYGYPIYHPYPVTYGYGAYYNTYTGAYGAARGVYGPYGVATVGAAYNPYTGTYARGASVYGPYGSASAGRAYNPYTGTMARGGSVTTPYGTAKGGAAYNPYTGAYARGGSVSTANGTRSAAGGYNPSTGVGAATRQGSSPYGQWGSSVVSNGNQAVQAGHVSTSQGTVAGARSTSGAAVAGGSGGGTVARSSSGDMYASKDGNVYKNTGSGWQSYNNGGWNSANAQAQQARSSAQQRAPTQEMNQEFQNRQRGAAQSQSFENFQRSGGGGWGGDGGGGGRSFGGGGGRSFGGGGRRR